MKRTVISLALSCAVAAGCSEDRDISTSAPQMSSGVAINPGSGEAYTLAVIGDIPYGPTKIAELPDLINLINSDPKVDLVAHLGDIKAGSSSPCTDTYFDSIRSMFDGFKDPLVYTPGDNEWTDCHVASKNNGLYTPTERLLKVRSVFFPVAGQSLGVRKKQLLTQADDLGNSDYIENTMWMEAHVLFATLHVVGSNNDLASWGSPLPANAGNYQSQADEVQARAQANHDWLDKAFQTAKDNGADGVVLLMQADMWDPTAALSGFDDLVKQIGNGAIAFGKPVLILEGDSHVFNVDNPFSTSSAFHSLHPNTPVAGNVTRIVVEGSAAGRTEYLRLTIDPRGTQLFTTERVPLH